MLVPALNSVLRYTRYNLLRLSGGVELDGNTHSGVDAVDTFTRADVSVQSIVVQLIDVDRSVLGGGRAALPDLLQFVRHRYRLADSRLKNKENIRSDFPVFRWLICAKPLRYATLVH